MGAPVRFRRKALAVCRCFRRCIRSCSLQCRAVDETPPSPPERPDTNAGCGNDALAHTICHAERTAVQKVNANYKKFDPKNFGDPTGDPNRWYPLVPGTQTLRDGSITRGSRKLTHQLRVTVTDVMKEVNGVRTVLVLDQDIDAGQVGEASMDYLAQDKFGNIWYLGSYTEHYEGGQFVNAVDAWLAGEKGAKPGVWMLTDPKEGMKYVQTHTSGETIRAEVDKVEERKCVPFKCFKSLADRRGRQRVQVLRPGRGPYRNRAQLLRW